MSVEKKILLTGASSGIGLSTAKLLLNKGFSVIGLSRTKPPIDHPLFTYFKIDLMHITEDLCKELLETTGPIDALICNAGQGKFSNLEEFSFAQIKDLMEINFTSHALLTRFFLPHLKRRSHANIVFIGSEAALLGKRKGTVYCASKFALRGFAQALRDECSTSSVRISIFQPGMTDTPFFDRLDFKPDISIDPEQIAKTILFILSTGPDVVFDEITLSPVKKKLSFTKFCEK
ncbi:MAG: short-chain dehydrogenase [Chlamydiae bacterium CG10_big_fil_rev_8_21_14_0_10_35_9]|nr:MAG: short-chain dehydrogenase [Chlamydiae bacterium CG10_big_fil_rev_8_21_14_0_10_35_9]